MVEPDENYRIGRRLSAASRRRSLAIVALSYLLAGGGAAVTAAALPGVHPLIRTLAADVAATVLVFALSVVLANASLYDPYWSVAPPVVAVAWAVLGWPGATAGEHVRQVVVGVLVAVWAVRLTANWMGTWRGLGHEDWRYVQLRRQTRGRLPWPLVSLGGIQLMPTLVVFAGLLSLWPAMVAGRRPVGALDILAAAVTVTAIAVEAAADRQLHRFTADPGHRGQIADQGLWRYSRHPNYLGEIGFWWGLWLFGLAAAPDWWWTAVGPITIVVLFVAASIPLMDRRSKIRRPGYEQYARTVPALLPRPWRAAPPRATANRTRAEPGSPL